ncbi:glycerate kinase [Gordonia defluvii]|jgi:glycerate kinase|uniref:Glycerate kinase n=1 Tax=Gordonia defluvii TaxID=283718 RepID=A0ABP6LCX2_9ACTN|nr:glycerate kinase [Gordonia sp. UBA5067]
MALRVVVAPDSFGATLTAARAAAAIAYGWSSVRPADAVLVKPQSDGGPGFIDCLDGVGRLRAAPVAGPLGETTMARWRIAGHTAYLECAQVCGLHLIGRPEPRTALAASTAGVGQLITAALRADRVTRLVIGLGGSATTDGGRGMLDALGGPDAATGLLAGVRVVAATDVDNPLTGPRGAAAVFAPQKGADQAAVELLTDRLAHIGAEFEIFAGRPVSDEPGAGAAGGLGAALLALGATRVSGADLVARATGLPAAMRRADVVITGEGRLDDQTAAGKVVARVAAAAPPGVEVIALVGDSSAVDPGLRRRLRLDTVASLVDHVGRAAAFGDAAASLASLAARVAGRRADTGRGDGNGETGE